MNENKILKGDNIINIINENNNLNYELKDDSNVVINIYNDNPNDLNINVVQNNNSKVIINLAHFINNDIKVNIDSLVKGNNNKTVINERVIAKNGHGVYDVSIKVEPNTKNNEVYENLKGFNEDGKVTLNPILKIDSKEAIASHNATVGNFDKNIIFYLKSKGIKEKDILDLLKLSFINNLFNKDFMNLLNKGKDNNE